MFDKRPLAVNFRVMKFLKSFVFSTIAVSFSDVVFRCHMYHNIFLTECQYLERKSMKKFFLKITSKTSDGKIQASIFVKTVLDAVLIFIGHERGETDVFDALEDVLLDLGILAFQRIDELFYLLALAAVGA